MRRRFIPASQQRAAERLIASRARHGDVYVGVALRNSASHGGRASVAASHLAWVESDNPRSAALLEAFPHPPCMLIASGTPGHLQAYWALEHRRDVVELERLNRRLAYALAGDPGCTDAARILRPPGTLNYKHDRAKAGDAPALPRRRARQPGATERRAPNRPGPAHLAARTGRR